VTENSAPAVKGVRNRLAARLSALALIAANSVSLIGVLFWNWDGFLLLMLYWMETGIVAFWTILRILVLPEKALGDLLWATGRGFGGRIGVAAFFAFHAGIFMLVHFGFLWFLFAGEWDRKVHGLSDFLDQIVVATGLWLPLIALFIGHGAVFMFDVFKPQLFAMFDIRERSDRKLDAPAQDFASTGSDVIASLYSRIIITVIIGGSLSILLQSRALLVGVIAVKTLIDLFFQFRGASFSRRLAEGIVASAKATPPSS
jgi:hypothetical protein